MTSFSDASFAPAALQASELHRLYPPPSAAVATSLDLLKDYQRRHGFRITEVDIDPDPELVAKYGTEVPVVAVSGKVRFRGVVNPALLERLLAAESLGEASSAKPPSQAELDRDPVR